MLENYFLHFYCRLTVGVSVAVSLEFKQKIIQIYLSPSIDISWLRIKNACTHQTYVAEKVFGENATVEKSIVLFWKAAANPTTGFWQN